MKYDNLTLGVDHINKAIAKGQISEDLKTIYDENTKYYYGAYHVARVYDTNGRFYGYALTEVLYN